MKTRLLTADEAGIKEAATILANGGLVAIPTETVYGLACDASNGRAVAGVYAAKGRPSFNPLIVHVAEMEVARREGQLQSAPGADRLASRFWPGPLTLVVPRADTGTVSELARAGLDSVAIRMPSHPVALALLRKMGNPIAAPSANRSGHVSPTTAAHVLADLDGRIDAVLDAGPSEVGIESTIVSCLGSKPVVLRPGGLPRDELEQGLGTTLDGAMPAPGDAPLAPGMLTSHYATRARIRLDAVAPMPGEAWLGFGGALPQGAGMALDLSPGSDLAEAAANLFGHLRRLDASGAARIAVAPIPAVGLGEAILDRLQRAAAER